MEEKQLKNLFDKLINDENSVFFSADRINQTLLRKGKKSSYEKDKVFLKLFNVAENKKVIYEKEERVPFYTPFAPQKRNIDRSTLYTVNGPLQFFHADIAFLKFLAKSAVDPKYALLCVDLFTSKVYVYTMRKKSNLVNKLETFYKEIEPKRDKKEIMRLQTDQEFQQNEIKKINLKYNMFSIDMFSMNIRGGKAFAAEQKIRELKKILFKTKNVYKRSKKKINSKKIIEKAIENMNKINSEKYGLPPEIIEKKTLSDNVFKEMFDFYRMVKVSKAVDRYEPYNEKVDERQKKKLREPLEIDEKVLILAERIKKKDAPGILFKSTTQNVPFFNKKEIFKIRKYNLVDNVYNYWIKKENNQKIDKRFIREELFALENNFK